MKILCVGEMVADVVVKPVPVIDFKTDSVIVQEISIKNGGDALNTAVGLGKLSHDVVFIGRAGNDVFGRQIVEIAREAGVNVEHVVFSKTEENSKVIALIREDGERCFLHRVGSNKELCAADIDMKVMEQCGHLHIGGTFHLDTFDGEQAAQVLKCATELGLTTSMDVAYDHSGRWLSLIRCCMPYLTYFVPSLNEAQHMLGSEDCRYITEAFKKEGVKNVIVKLGKEGVYCDPEDGKPFRCGTYDVPVVDATGAGDGFMAGLISGIADGLPLTECVVRGTANAAFVIQAVGATSGVPDRSRLLEFINSTERPEIVYV
jgi:sugar/nucleoside kinase (ribokinase family)